jgi:hypothetical protein
MVCKKNETEQQVHDGCLPLQSSMQPQAPATLQGLPTYCKNCHAGTMLVLLLK